MKKMKLGEFTKEQVLSFAKKIYSEGVADFEIRKEKCALLVIDMQDEFVKPHWCPFWIPGATDQVSRINKLIQFCRKNDIPIIWTVMAKTHFYRDRPKSGKFMPNGYEFLDMDMSHLFVEGNIYKNLDVKPEYDVILKKCSYGAFYDTPLETILKSYERDTIIITGTLTNYCCGTTAREGYARGFNVIFGSDLTATDDPAMQEPEEKTLRKGFARIMKLSEILNVLEN